MRRLLAALACFLSSVTGQSLPLFYGAESPDYNIAAINNVLNSVSYIRQPGEAYALYDWDNTCMYGDISESSIYYQVQNLNFRILPEQFATVFAMGYNASNGDQCLPQGINTVIGKSATQALTLQSLIQDVSQDYLKLFYAYIGPTYNLQSTTAPPCFTTTLQANMTLAAVRQTTEYNDFVAKFGNLVFALENTNGGDDFLPCAQNLAMTTLPQLLVGMTEAEIKDLIRQSIRYNLNAAISTVSFTSSNGIQGSYPTGVRVFNGQEASMRAFQGRNISVYVISASPQYFVDVAATFYSLTYNVPKDNILGVRFTMDNGKFTGKLVGGDYPITWGPGKATVTNNIIRPRHNGKAPIWGSGDSQGDCAFLALVQDGIVLVNNRLQTIGNCMQQLYEKACQLFNQVDSATNARYLLQGQDKQLGSWINSGWTTKDGVIYTSGTNSDCSAYKFI